MVKEIGFDELIRSSYDEEILRQLREKQEEIRRKEQKIYEKSRKIHTITCQTCGAVVTYSELDEQEVTDRVTAYSTEVVAKTIRCPHCQKNIVTQKYD